MKSSSEEVITVSEMMISFMSEGVMAAVTMTIGISMVKSVSMVESALMAITMSNTVGISMTITMSISMGKAIFVIESTLMVITVAIAMSITVMGFSRDEDLTRVFIPVSVHVTMIAMGIKIVEITVMITVVINRMWHSMFKSSMWGFVMVPISIVEFLGNSVGGNKCSSCESSHLIKV